MQKKGEQQNRALKGITDNTKELPVESQDLLLILARGMMFTQNYMIRQNAADQPRMPPDKHSAWVIKLYNGKGEINV